MSEPIRVADQKRNPHTALQQLRQRMYTVTKEYADGKLNADQFQAIYKHYMEKRAIIERLLERNPQSDAWRAAASPGRTHFLREQFEARPVYCVVFRRGATRPLLNIGRLPRRAAEQIHKLLAVIWNSDQWRKGLARKSLGDSMWLLLMAGEQSMTLTVFFFQPSAAQMNQMRDLHLDFERANKHLLAQNLGAERMVFPQRSLLPQ